MAKELTMRVFANGIDLNKVLVTQDEWGHYWMANGALARFILSEFGKAHKGHVLENDGSHKSYLNEHAIDFSLNGGTKLTSNKSLKLVGERFIKGYKLPYGLEWVYGNHHFITFHVRTTAKVGQYVEAGKVFATVMTPAENKQSGRFDKDYPNGFPSHLHMGTNNDGSFDDATIRDFILAPIVVAPPPVVIPDPVTDPEPVPVIDYKAMYNKALQDHTEYVTAQTIKYNKVIEAGDIIAGILDNIGKVIDPGGILSEKDYSEYISVRLSSLNAFIKDARDAVHFTGANMDFRYYLEQLYARDQEAEKRKSFITKAIKWVSEQLNKLLSKKNE